MAEPDPRDLLDAISALNTEVLHLKNALNLVAQVVAQDATVAADTVREVQRIVRVARELPDADADDG